MTLYKTIVFYMYAFIHRLCRQMQNSLVIKQKIKSYTNETRNRNYKSQK